MAKLASIVFSIVLASACANTPPVDGTDEKRSTLAMKCGDFDLTNDCSFFGGAKRRIEIDGFEVRIAGSTDGRTVLLMDAKLASNVISDDLRLHIGKDRHSSYVNESYNKVKALLEEHEIEIEKTIRVGKLDEIDGYVIVTNGDAYSALKSLTVDENK